MKRLVHTVSDHGDLEMAMALGSPVRALCGKRWVPTLIGDETKGLHPCPTCKSLNEPPKPRRRGPKPSPDPSRPHYVYRFYDAADRLIYVGCTNNPVHRFRAHRKNSWWADQIVRTRLIVFPNRGHALAKEREAIGEERPRWNVKGRWPYRGDHWTAEDYVDFRHAITQAIDTTHGVYGVRTDQLLAEIDAELLERFGVTAMQRRSA